MTDLGMFAKTGALIRVPGGNVEDVQAQLTVNSWMSLNVGGDVGRDPSVWDSYRQRASNRMPVFPWMHCRDIDDVEFLISVGHRWKEATAIGLNIEDVFRDKLSLEEVSRVLDDQWSGEVLMPTLPWVQNGQGWGHLARCVAALEIFADEQSNTFPTGKPDPVIVQQCVDHAFDEGLTKVTLMLKTKSPFVPSDYDLGATHSFYTADDVGTPESEKWPPWKDTKSPTVPPKHTGGPVPPDPDEKMWYEKPYLQGPPVGPEELPRVLYPPSAGKGTFAGDDVTAFKRAISRAGRLKPWAPATWSPTYGEQFAVGKGTGNVGDSGVRGFQRQTFPGQSNMQTGFLGKQTYQAIRRSLVSDPQSPNYKKPLLDATAVKLLELAAKEFSKDAAIADFRQHLADFCERAEAADSELWTYSQARPFTGLGVAPELAHVNDCSGYAVLAYFWARTKSGLAVDDPSGYEYAGFGNTWDDLDGHPKVTSGSYLVGDLAHYDGHVTICRKAGDKDTAVWSSFGSEPKPEPRELHYRGDFLKVVRPPLD